MIRLTVYLKLIVEDLKFIFIIVESKEIIFFWVNRWKHFK